MKIECPKCKASLRVDESKIPEKGVYAKCPKCQGRILVKKDVVHQKTDLESELKEPIGHQKEIERETPIKKDFSAAGGKTAINDRKVKSFGPILFWGGIFLLIAVPVFFSLFNSFVEKREYQRAEQIRQEEIRKNIDIFSADSEVILKRIEELIEQGKTDLAEKELRKFDIPVLKEVYPEIQSFKDRINAANNKVRAPKYSRNEGDSEAYDYSRYSRGSDSRGGHEIEAFVASQRFVEQRLKAPSSADFCSYTDADVKYLGNGRYRVIAYVDAQNSFGAELRTRYKCILKHEGGYDWYLEGLSF